MLADGFSKRLLRAGRAAFDSSGLGYLGRLAIQRPGCANIMAFAGV
jgi:hypothetical protein